MGICWMFVSNEVNWKLCDKKCVFGCLSPVRFIGDPVTRDVCWMFFTIELNWRFCDKRRMLDVFHN